MTDKSLSELAKLRVEARGSPATTNYTNLKHYIELRTSCWIVEQVGREFYCDCPVGITGHICKHVMALAYDHLNFPVLDTLQPKRFNNLRRKVGRPAKVGPALCTKGPNNVATIN